MFLSVFHTPASPRTPPLPRIYLRIRGTENVTTLILKVFKGDASTVWLIYNRVICENCQSRNVAGRKGITVLA